MKNIFYIVAFFLFLLSVLIICFGTTSYYEDFSYDFGMAIGRSLTFMLIVYPITRWVLKKKLGKIKKGSAILCYCTLLLISSSYQTIMLSLYEKELAKSEKGLEELNRIVKNAIAGNTEFSPTSNYSVDEFGEMGHLVTIMNDMFEFTNKENQKLENAFKTAKIEDALLPANLVDPSYVKKNLGVLEMLEKEINESEIRRMQFIKGTDAEINELYEKNKPLIASYNISKTKSVRLIKAYFAIHRDAISELKNLMNFLTSIEGKYWNENDLIMFQDEALMEKYNEFISRIVNLGEKGENLLKEIEKHYQSVFDESI